LDRTEEERYRLVIELCRQLEALLFGGDAPHELLATGLGQQLAFVFYSQVRSLLRATVILVRALHPEEARPLIRHSFSTRLSFQELADRPNERDALALAWRRETLREMDNLVREAVASGLEDDRRAWDGFIQAQRAKLDKRAEDGAIVESLPVPDDLQLAIQHDRRQDYWTHKYASVSIHRPDFAQLRRLRYGPEAGTAIAYLTNPDPEELSATIATAMSYTLHAHIAACTLFGWAPDSATALLARIDELGKE
jgi:hypothetical protein